MLAFAKKQKLSQVEELASLTL